MDGYAGMDTSPAARWLPAGPEEGSFLIPVNEWKGEKTVVV